MRMLDKAWLGVRRATFNPFTHYCPEGSISLTTGVRIDPQGARSPLGLPQAPSEPQPPHPVHGPEEDDIKERNGFMGAERTFVCLDNHRGLCRLRSWGQRSVECNRADGRCPGLESGGELTRQRLRWLVLLEALALR